MAGLIVDNVRFYKPSTPPRLKVGDAGVEIVLESAHGGFEIRVIRGKILSLPETPLERPPLSRDRENRYAYHSQQEAQRAFTKRCDALTHAGYRTR
jgi:hypothetical protein